MKKIKNNKGLTGIDIVVSITIIVIVLGVVTAIYGAYSKKAKEVKRTTTATNLAMTVIEKIEEKDISSITTKSGSDEIDLTTGYDVDSVPNGYTITAIKKELSTGAPDDDLMNSLAFQVEVTVTYNVQNKEKSITLSTIKKNSETEEAEKPNIKGDKIYNNGEDNPKEKNIIPVKFDIGKDGYVRTNQYDSEWYSISSKAFPMVIKLKSGEDFNRNGIIKLNQCDSIYIWVPSYIVDDNNNYKFVTKLGADYYDIIYSYITIDGKKIYYYKRADNALEPEVEVIDGYWQKINADEEPIDNKGNPITLDDNPYNTIKNKIFTW